MTHRDKLLLALLFGIGSAATALTTDDAPAWAVAGLHAFGQFLLLAASLELAWTYLRDLAAEAWARLNLKRQERFLEPLAEPERILPATVGGRQEQLSLGERAPLDPADLRYFVQGVFRRGHSRSQWLRARLPSGRVLRKAEDYDAFIDPLLASGLIVERGDRRSGRLSVSTYEAALERLVERGYLPPLLDDTPTGKTAGLVQPVQSS